MPAVAGLLLVFAVRVAPAQIAATVPASSGIYERLEAITAWYPTRGVFLGERPMSVRDVRRAAQLLSRRLAGAPPGSRRDWASRELALVEDAVGSTAGSGPVAWSWRANAGGTDARVERITPNGLGGRDSAQRAIGIEARRDAFDAGRDGLPGNRTTVAVLPTLAAGGRSVVIAAEPLLAVSQRAADSASWTPALHRAYARAVWRNTAVRLGADELRWGQSPLGALFISGNAAPLHALTVGTDTPVTLPWLLRLAGPFRVTGMLADLGAWQTARHAKLAGWQASIQPWSRFELGVSVLSQQGGSGSPKASFLTRVIDLFPVIDALKPGHGDIQISNKLAGGNLRLRFPELSGLDLYYELQIDDFDGRRLRSSLVEDSGHLLGLRLPLLLAGGQLTWRAEWQRTSLRLYEHGQFQSGVTYQGRIIGNPLGPNAKGAYLSAAWEPSPVSRFVLGFADERRNPSIFSVAISGPYDRGFRFVLDTLIPDYRRDRLTASVERRVGDVVAQLAVGGARSWQRTYPGRTDWLVEIALRRDLLRAF